jgi:hypothetical protein
MYIKVILPVVAFLLLGGAGEYMLLHHYTVSAPPADIHKTPAASDEMCDAYRMWSRKENDTVEKMERLCRR